MNFIQQPQRIESTSFEIIDEIIATEFPDYQFANELEKKVITRAVHTTADFDWLEILKFSPDALATLQTAIMKAAHSTPIPQWLSLASIRAF